MCGSRTCTHPAPARASPSPQTASSPTLLWSRPRRAARRRRAIQAGSQPGLVERPRVRHRQPGHSLYGERRAGDVLRSRVRAQRLRQRAGSTNSRLALGRAGAAARRTGAAPAPPPNLGSVARHNSTTGAHRPASRSVNEVSAGTAGDVKHARYTVKNDVIQHDENQTNPWGQPEGRDAARASVGRHRSIPARPMRTRPKAGCRRPFMRFR